MTNTKKAMKKLLAAISELVTAIESMDTLEKVQSDYYFIHSMGDDLSNCEKTLDKLRVLSWDKVAPLTIDEKGYEIGENYEEWIKAWDSATKDDIKRCFRLRI